ncbi:hypothetical protein OROGR_009024 [Orobanche gracilis]
MSKGDGREEDRNKDTSSSSTLDSRFSQTLRNVQGLMRRLLKGRSFPGKVLITRRSDPLGQAVLPSPSTYRGFYDTDVDHGEQADRSTEDEVQNRSDMYANTSIKNSSSSTIDSGNVLIEIHKPTVGARATDSTRIMKFTRELSGATVVVGVY